MQLVVLAAGHGRRFGGLKQLAPVGPNGEAIMDYTVAAAASDGYDGAVIVVREEILDEVKHHALAHFPSGFRVEFAIQGPRRGTAEAVACTAPFIDGPFAVANADDLYGAEAIASVRTHFRTPTTSADETSAKHVLVGYQLGRTVLTDCTVTRGVIRVGADGDLVCIEEHAVALQPDGSFVAIPLRHLATSAPPAEKLLIGTESVSMNLWGFHPRIFDELHVALGEQDASDGAQKEVLLPEVIGGLVTTGNDKVHVVRTTSRCIGITNPDDFALVRDELAVLPSFTSRFEASQRA